MWIACTEDRAFLRDLARDVIAAEAAEELEVFDTLVKRYFADPTPPTDPRRHRQQARSTVSAPPHLAEVTPAALAGVLNYIVMELETASQHAPTEGIKAGLRGLLRRQGCRQGEGLRLLPASKGQPERLTVMIYAYLLPIAVTIPTQVLAEIARTTGQIYRLDEQRCMLLSKAILSRLSR